MFRNFFITAYRNLLRNRFFTLINLAGLSTGMAACIMIAQYVTFERSYDLFHTDHENIYRMVNVRYFPTHKDESAGCVTALGPALKEMFPEVVNYTRCYRSERTFTTPDQKAVRFTNVLSVDSTFLDIFSFPVTEGGQEALLHKPQTAVLTVAAAQKLFGNKNAVGETIILAGQLPYLVEAVIKDPPANSHMQFDMLLSLVTDYRDPQYCWSCNNRNTYVQLTSGTDPATFENNIQRVIAKIHPGETIRREYKLQTLGSIHLHSNLRFELDNNGNAKSVIALTIIGGLILFIAWLNYINLSTSMAISRSNEVGIRKVNGSTRRNLIAQFLIESFLINSIAMIAALLLAEAVFPIFSSQLGIDPSLTLLQEFRFWAYALGTIVVGSLIYGFYPAIVISSFKPLEAMKGKSLLPRGSRAMRTALVFIQFTFSIILIAGTLAVYRQITFMKNMDLGMNIDQTLAIRVPAEYQQREDGFAAEVSTHSMIKLVTHTSEIPGDEIGSVGGGHRPEGAPLENGQQAYSLYVASNYFEYFSIGFLAGHGFVNEQTSEALTRELVINDAARKAFGFTTPEEALGKIIYQNDFIKGKVTGVVRDHHHRSADHAITPMIFQFTRGKSYYLVKTSASLGNIQFIEKVYKKHFANNPFEYFFLDDHFKIQYRGFERFGNSFMLFTILAIFIACLGLSGLTLYMVRVRSKEIALRKVLGASVAHLIMMVSREYALLLAGAFIVAAPFAWYVIQQWLRGFAYHVDLHWTMLIIPGLLTLVIAWITIAAQSLKTMLKNPTESLRTE